MATYHGDFAGGQLVQRTAHRASAGFKNMRVDHGGFHAAVAEKLLDGPDVVTGGQQVCGKRMAQGMRGGPLAHPDRRTASWYARATGAFVQVKANLLARPWIDTNGRRGKDELPAEFAAQAEKGATDEHG